MKKLPSNLLLLFFLLALSGCVSLGPKTIQSDRAQYIGEISESWKKQMLLNIVKLRYFDLPVFLDVASIISQFGMEQQVGVDGGIAFPHTGRVGGSGSLRYSDRPTITYTPLSGQKFTKNLLTPIPPHAVVSMIQSGWPADLILSITVKSINGINNYSGIKDFAEENQDFRKLIQAWRKVQLGGAVDIRPEKINDTDTIALVISDERKKAEYSKEIQTMRDILGLKPETSKFAIMFGTLPRSNQEIAFLTRSMLEIMMEMSAMVEVPPKHIEEKRANPMAANCPSDRTLVRVHSGSKKPSDAFVAVRYRHFWFWVDDRDIPSKRNFTLLMIFLSLTETDQKGAGPLLTLGAG